MSRPERTTRRRLPAAALLPAALAGGLLAGCLDLGLVRDIAFPPGIPGLPTGEPWTLLPVDAWVTDGGIVARGIAACLQPACPAPALVGLFTATGPDAERLGAAVRDPARLAAFLAQTRSSDGRGRRTTRPRDTVRTSVERVSSSRLSGFALAMSRPDGGRSVHGEALLLPGRGSAILVLVIAADEARVKDLAGAVANALSSGPDGREPRL